MSQSANGGPVIGVNPLMPFTAQQVQANLQARQLIKQQGARLRQAVQSGSFAVATGASYNISMTPQPIGLVTGFVLEMVAVITNPGGGSVLTRNPDFNAANMLSSINYQNPSGLTPIQNEPGWALASVMAGRKAKIPGAAYTTDSPLGFGSVIQPIAAPSSIAAGASGTVSFEYEIPLAYAEKLGNFQGAVWAGTTYANQNIQVTWNPLFIQVGGASTPFMVGYKGASAVVANQPTMAVSWTLYQVYYDQFDPTLINYLTPDLSTAYYLNTQPISALSPNAQNNVPFVNLRTFLSLTLAYSNGGTFNPGTDINNFQLVSANQLPYWLRTTSQQSYITRDLVNCDFPPGYYYFDFRDNPVSTQASGNTYLNFNPSSVANGSTLTAAWEYLAIQQIIAGAPSIQS
jgi:hypothetical protein